MNRITDSELDEIEKMTAELEAHNAKMRTLDPDSILPKFIEGALNIGKTRQMIAELRALRGIVKGAADVDMVQVDRYAGCEQIRGWDCLACGFGWQDDGSHKPTIDQHADTCAYRRAVEYVNSSSRAGDDK